MTPDPDIVRELRAAGCVFAEEEAAVLTDAAAGPPDLDALVARRVAGEPLEQVVGHADFCGVRVRLRPGVFVPRVRSELLVRTAAAEARDGSLVVDLCCGSGALGLAVRHRVPGITLHAADLDPAAVACAKENLTAESRKAGDGDEGNGDEDVTGRGRAGDVHQGDLYDALPAHLRGHIDVLLANVPYVATAHLPFLPPEARDHEPRAALDGGDDGLHVFRAVAAGAPEWLAPAGLLLTEITEAQAATALAIAGGNGLTATVVTDDDLDACAIIARPAPGR
ncbi:methyltransferase [Actinoplanes sp. DH11]|uniref:methyltransferase n=1 Tax=Actinoplanes sp. DH11 TaxID=2857011 RepID=UPI001E3062CB|nr:methyltransferase [Actinoplanes sp. DH11]